LVERGVQGSVQLIVRPSLASYYPGEQPSFTVQFRRPKRGVKEHLRTGCRLGVLDEQGRTVGQLDIPLLGSGGLATGSARMTGGERLRPGLYQVNAALYSQLKSFHVLRCRTGFWVYDDALIRSGKPITAGNRYLLRDGKTFPVTGTTYMASDVHRKFLFEPNPYVWNRDFGEMKAAGVNMIRSGIWTGWKQIMPDAGAPNEAALRAMDAFVLTARKFDIPIIFTLFAFLPESWGGANPYLDPRSVNAQKEFVTAFAHRYRQVNDIIWDLINEPSFCNPQYLWQCRPNYDRYETEAWQVWLKERYARSSDETTTARIHEAHRSPSDEAITLPAKEDFEDVNVFQGRRPIKAIDYRLFAQEMFIRWVKEITGAIRGAQGSGGRPSQLITVGQDEGGTYDSPGNQFFGNAVDFTCVHNWWLNDDLLWDQAVTTIPGKPNLVEETGVMFYEKMDATPWRTEEEARNLLERKMAVALGAGGAGFIQWLWNTNPYMASDNEAAIGFHRADGTAKPELEPMRRLARFFEAHRQLMDGGKEEDVVMVIPHSQIFSTRNFAAEATRRCVRVMNEHFSTPVATVSEYRPMSGSPKLLIMPSPRTMNQQCWERLLSCAERGSTVLLTGTIDADDHWLPVERSKTLGVEATSKPVAEEEFLRIGDTEYRVSYRGEKIQRVEKAVIRTDQKPTVITI
ncbi:MAG: glycoside hydrolase, partial [Ignavibacteria bacterium]